MKNTGSTPTTTEEAKVTLNPEQAIGPMRAVLQWLNGQPAESKLATALVFALRHLQEDLHRVGIVEHTETVGNDIIAEWTRDIFDGPPLSDPAAESVRQTGAMLSKMTLFFNDGE